MTTDINPAIAAMLRSARDFLMHEQSLFRSLGLKAQLIGAGRATFSFDLPAAFDDGTGCAHGGLMTIVLDSIFGLAVFTALEELKPIATISLRTDTISPLAVGARAVCAAECIGRDRDVAYVQGRITAERDGRLAATGSGAFMVGTSGPMKPGPSMGSRI